MHNEIYIVKHHQNISNMERKHGITKDWATYDSS